MKIVNILGGLGNQMFQYAFALKLQQLFPNEQIKIYTKAFRGYPLHNGYELKRIFRVNLPEASIWEVSKKYWPISNYNIYRLCRYLMPNRKGFKDSYINQIQLSDSERYSFYDGYFQRASLFEGIEEIIKQAFAFPEIDDNPNQITTQFLSERMTASLHVRRGDYLKDKNYCGICGIDYYKKAIKILKQETGTKRVLVFSNDMEWSKINLQEDLDGFEVMYIDWNTKSNSFRDMQLMSMCHHNIIANSSFSWWGAYLNRNPEKIVISPYKWANSHQDAPILPNKWIKVNCTQT